MFSRFDSVPLAPRRYPFFYGWIIVVMGIVGVLMSGPGQTHGVSPFTDTLIEVLGLTRVQLSLAYMFGTIGSSLLLTHAGRLYDRWGARVIIPASSAILGCILVVSSQCDRITRVIAGAIDGNATQVVAFVVIMLCFFVLRFSGQGVLTMVSRNLVMKWFDRYRGTVTGVTGMIMAPMFSAIPAVLNTLVNQFGWRQAWLLLAVVVGLLFTGVALLFVRDNPESCGLLPDGPLRHRRRKGEPEAPPPPCRDYTLAEARRTYPFWIFTLGLALFGLYFTGLSFHIGSIFEGAGMTREAGFAVFMPSAAVALVLRPGVGWLCDRVPLKYLLIFMVVGLAVSASGLWALRPGWPVWLLIAGNGIASSTFGSLCSVTWPNFFGRPHLGAISGFNTSIVVFASAIGPSTFSGTEALSGRYDSAAATCVAIALVLIVAACRADNPQKA
jgi:MFS transporter, OFA family, oxalate/formate antiporter